MSTFAFTWGDVVQVMITAPRIYRPGSFGSVCGMRSEKQTAAATRITQPENQEIPLYLVEFGDGISVEIPEHYLEATEE